MCFVKLTFFCVLSGSIWFYMAGGRHLALLDIKFSSRYCISHSLGGSAVGELVSVTFGGVLMPLGGKAHEEWESIPFRFNAQARILKHSHVPQFLNSKIVLIIFA